MNQEIKSACAPGEGWFTFTQDIPLVKIHIWETTIVSILLCIGGHVAFALTPEKPVIGIILLHVALVPTFWAVYLNLCLFLSTQTRTSFRQHCVQYLASPLFLFLHISFTVAWLLSTTMTGSKAIAAIFHELSVLFCGGYIISSMLSLADTLRE